MPQRSLGKVVVRAEHFSYWHPQCVEPTLKDLSFEVRKGELVLLAGRSGCGKTTLSLCLMGIRPGMLLGRSEGELLVNDVPLLGRSVHEIAQDINMVFQSPDDQVTNLTVEDEIVFGLENRQVPRAEMQAKLEEVLEICQLTHLRRRHVWRLSGGEKQRVAMASIIALEPPILVLDEPTSNLDPQGEREVWDAVERIRERYGATIVLVQHNIDAVLCRVDRVIMMDAGAVCFDGTAKELISRFRWTLRNEWGLWLPQAVEAGLYLQDYGAELECVPLSVEEAGPILGPRFGDCRELGVGNSIAEPGGNGNQGEPLEQTVEPWLRVADLRFRYSKETPEVLKGISFTVERGANLVILGPNGAGKSTLAMQLIGLLKPTVGQIAVEGEDIRPLTPAQLARRLAYVFQYPEHQFIANSVHQEMAHGPQALGWPEEQVAQKVEALLRRFGLWDLREHHPFNLSMGQKRRLSVACMLVMEPQTLILDEPTFGQDWKNATELMHSLETLNEQGTTIILITHNMRLVADFARRALVLVDGQIAFDGSPRDLFASPEVLAEAALEPPPVFQLGTDCLGRGVLTVEELCAALDVEGGRHGQ